MKISVKRIQVKKRVYAYRFFETAKAIAYIEKPTTEVTATRTGRSTVLAQHFIMSFKPGEVTPERAMEIGKELYEKYLKDLYQYYLAVHTDKSHPHLHCICAPVMG